MKLWGVAQDEAFNLAKDALQLQADSLLVHFDESKPLILSCDVSQYGIGAVLSDRMANGEERPIAYTSRTLNSNEKGYSQIEKEGLAIIFGTKKFHNYIYGRHFQIESDHKPLFYLFNEAKPILQMASARIQRWALTLATYQYSIRYKPGKLLCNADALSRLPRQTNISNDGLTGELINLINHNDFTGISVGNIKNWSAKDPTISQVQRYFVLGWPDKVDEKIQPYFNRRLELGLVN